VTPVRASDADREATAATLRAGHAEGRLDTEELEQRIAACYAARTTAKLEQLVADLPRQRAGGRPRSGFPWAGLLVPLALLALAAGAATHGHAFVLLPLALFAFLRLRGRTLPRGLR
jgi:hypothetical protein